MVDSQIKFLAEEALVIVGLSRTGHKLYRHQYFVSLQFFYLWRRVIKKDEELTGFVKLAATTSDGSPFCFHEAQCSRARL